MNNMNNKCGILKAWGIALLLIPVAGCRSTKTLNEVYTTDAPKAIGPYSQAIKHGNTIYCSGQIGLVAGTGAMAGADIAAQTKQALENMKAVLTAAATNMDHVMKVTIFLKDMENFATVNEIYSTYFTKIKPARSTVQVTKLPKDALIEIECIAALPHNTK